jgi:hypothetical protein
MRRITANQGCLIVGSLTFLSGWIWYFFPVSNQTQIAGGGHPLDIRFWGIVVMACVTGGCVLVGSVLTWKSAHLSPPPSAIPPSSPSPASPPPTAHEPQPERLNQIRAMFEENNNILNRMNLDQNIKIFQEETIHESYGDFSGAVVTVDPSLPCRIYGDIGLHNCNANTLTLSELRQVSVRVGSRTFLTDVLIPMKIKVEARHDAKFTLSIPLGRQCAELIRNTSFLEPLFVSLSGILQVEYQGEQFEFKRHVRLFGSVYKGKSGPVNH